MAEALEHGWRSAHGAKRSVVFLVLVAFPLLLGDPDTAGVVSPHESPPFVSISVRLIALHTFLRLEAGPPGKCTARRVHMVHKWRC